MSKSFEVKKLRVTQFEQCVKNESVIDQFITKLQDIPDREYIVIKYTPSNGFVVYSTDVSPDYSLLVYSKSDYLYVLNQVGDKDKTVRVIQTAFYLTQDKIKEQLVEAAIEQRYL